jgi:hypothetical protein
VTIDFSFISNVRATDRGLSVQTDWSASIFVVAGTGNLVVVVVLVVVAVVVIVVIVVVVVTGLAVVATAM